LRSVSRRSRLACFFMSSAAMILGRRGTRAHQTHDSFPGRSIARCRSNDASQCAAEMWRRRVVHSGTLCR
jgi:hypothetical protein